MAVPPLEAVPPAQIATVAEDLAGGEILGNRIEVIKRWPPRVASSTTIDLLSKKMT